MAGRRKSGAGGALAAAAILMWLSGGLVGFGVAWILDGLEGAAVLTAVGAMMSAVAALMLTRVKT